MLNCRDQWKGRSCRTEHTLLRSVTNAIAQCRLDYYWKHTSFQVPIRKALWSRSPRFTNLITELLAGKAVEMQYQVMASYDG